MRDDEIGYIIVDHAPVGSGFSVCPDGRARELLPRFPEHIAFWTFSKRRDADEWASKLAAKAAGIEVLDMTSG
jgi:hypothetical protein